MESYGDGNIHVTEFLIVEVCGLNWEAEIYSGALGDAINICPDHYKP